MCILSQFNVKNCLFIVATLAAAANASNQDVPHMRLWGGLFHRLHHFDPPKYSDDVKPAEDQWFEQRLDHFNALNTKTWQQRYYTRCDFLRKILTQ